jgi:simple sugar transport system ATP-binding protein
MISAIVPSPKVPAAPARSSALKSRSRAHRSRSAAPILDEPTAALGVKQSVNVLKLIDRARAKGISVIFITHNVNHAYPVGDSFTLLNRGKSLGTFAKGDVTKDEVLDMMAGGAEMQALLADVEGATPP